MCVFVPVWMQECCMVLLSVRSGSRVKEHSSSWTGSSVALGGNKVACMSVLMCVCLWLYVCLCGFGCGCGCGCVCVD